jgi:hypothetical protein
LITQKLPVMPNTKNQQSSAKEKGQNKKQRKGDTSRTSSQGRKETSGGPQKSGPEKMTENK